MLLYSGNPSEVLRIGFPLYGCVSLSCIGFLYEKLNFVSSKMLGKVLLFAKTQERFFFKLLLFVYYLNDCAK